MMRSSAVLIGVLAVAGFFLAMRGVSALIQWMM